MLVCITNNWRLSLKFRFIIYNSLERDDNDKFYMCSYGNISNSMYAGMCVFVWIYLYTFVCDVYSELEHDRTLVKPARISWLWPKCQVHMPILQAPRAREQICISVTRSPVRCKNKNTSHLTPSSYQEDHRAHTHTHTHAHTVVFTRVNLIDLQF